MRGEFHRDWIRALDTRSSRRTQKRGENEQHFFGQKKKYYTAGAGAARVSNLHANHPMLRKHLLTFSSVNFYTFCVGVFISTFYMVCGFLLSLDNF